MKTPELNVNLRRCDCPTLMMPDVPHLQTCPGTPVLIPCPIPRSVTFTVRLGECRCLNKDRAADGLHADSCPARPIRVSCSSGGETWPDSKVIACDSRDLVFVPDAVSAACRARWEIVKALVTGRHSIDSTRGLDLAWLDAIFTQRDAVLAKVATLARSEQAYAAAYSDAWLSIGQRKAPNMEGLTSTTILGEYVEHIIEQAGVL